MAVSEIEISGHLHCFTFNHPSLVWIPPFATPDVGAPALLPQMVRIPLALSFPLSPLSPPYHWRVSDGRPSQCPTGEEAASEPHARPPSGRPSTAAKPTSFEARTPSWGSDGAMIPCARNECYSQITTSVLHTTRDTMRHMYIQSLFYLRHSFQYCRWPINDTNTNGTGILFPVVQHSIHSNHHWSVLIQPIKRFSRD